MPSTYNLFISHSWSYSDDYNRLISLLDEYPYFSYKDFSVPKHDPIHNAPSSKALYDAIYRQMASAHIVVIMAGKYATFSTWINNEIKIAKNEFLASKPILAVVPWGNQQISTVVQNNADDIVRWNASSIIDSIRSLCR
ncbi:MAG TPA: molecular chaperone Tir [Candidatus Riflebacteria bacterium]|jgi:hypothetical protein|nr:molecular chaperone Tir [Candidatus Riflebacteria bacterium]